MAERASGPDLPERVELVRAALPDADRARFEQQLDQALDTARVGDRTAGRGGRDRPLPHLSGGVAASYAIRLPGVLPACRHLSELGALANSEHIKKPWSSQRPAVARRPTKQGAQAL
jgi:hypothetical protein